MNGVAMAVAIYVRVSTEEQRERQSIATQREFGDRYCRSVTGGIPAMPTMASRYRTSGPAAGRSRILERCPAHKFDQLLVYKLDSWAEKPG